MNFYEAHPRKVHFDMHSPKRIQDIGKDFDAQTYAKEVKNSGADAVVVFAKCAYGYTYFDNDYLPKHPGMISNDLFGDIRSALLEQDVETVAYFSTVSQAVEREKTDPDMLAVDVNGDFIHHEMDAEIGVACVNSDYWNKAYIPMLCQMVEKHGISAIWMDGYYQILFKTCYCEKCRKDYGHPIPVEKDDPNWRPYYHYIHKKINTILADIKKAVTAINPECCIGGDWIGSVTWGDEISDALDFFSCDVHPENFSFNTAYATAAWSWRDLPVDIYSERMYWWQDFNTRPVNAVILDQAITLASGGIWMIGDVITPYAMKVDSEKSRFYRTVFDELEPLYNATRKGRSEAEVALLLSVEDTRSHGDDWTLQNAKHKGMYSVLAESGYPIHILFENDLKEQLKNYKMLVISEADYLSSKAVDAIKEFVSEGGRLLVVGTIPAILDAETYIDSSTVLNRKDFEALTGTKCIGDDKENVSFFDVKDTKMAGIWGDEMFRLPEGVSGKAVRCHADSASVLCYLTDVGNSFQIGAPVPGELSADIAFSQNDYGQGSVMFAAQPLASNGWENGHVGSYHAIQCLIESLYEAPRYRLKGHSNTQIFPMIGTKEVYTIISHQQPSQNAVRKQMMNPSMTTGCKLELKGSVSKVINELTKEALIYEIKDGYTLIDVPDFTLFTSIGVER